MFEVLYRWKTEVAKIESLYNREKNKMRKTFYQLEILRIGHVVVFCLNQTIVGPTPKYCMLQNSKFFTQFFSIFAVSVL